MRDWIGKIIVSQYGLICDVTDAQDVDGVVMLTCQSRYKDKTWVWPEDTVSLVTKTGEIMDFTEDGFGLIYGRLDKTGSEWILYEDEDNRRILPEEVIAEFYKG